jgi:DNA-binding transcriptional LysR family regulator
MQNRRIINKVAASIGVEIKADVVSDSFLALLSYVRHGEWASIVPHTFAGLFAGRDDIMALDLVDPVHTQSIGFVLSDRDPLTPISGALLRSVEGVDFTSDLDRGAGR